MGFVRRGVLFGIGLAAWFSTALPASAVEATLVADAHVNSARPEVNSGAISNLNVGAGYTGLLQFDLSTLPVGTTAGQVSRAVLRLYCNRVDTAGTVSVQALVGAWGEYSVTYGTLPSRGSAVQTVAVSQEGAYVTVDVTLLVQGWVGAPATNFGVALTAAAAGVQFDSKENDLTGHAAVLDVSLTSTGPAGPAGSAGLTGPAGPVGPSGAAGPVGATGVQGPKGDAGSAGVAGATGSQGVAGPQGLPGPQGEGGLQGLRGVAGQPGVQGMMGPAGSAGPSGPAGVAGSAGPQGPPVSFLGGWLAGRSYAVGDVVSLAGTSYVAFVVSMGRQPDASPNYWAVLAQGGAAGSPGAAGAPGAVGMNYRGFWDARVAYQPRDAAVFAGTTYFALTSNQEMEPDFFPAAWVVLAQAGAAGPPGPTGPGGSAATMSVGTVTTGAAGTQAVVTNRGSATDAVLDFVIPEGAAGTSGGGGSGGGGTSGIPFASVYHEVAFTSTYYSVNSSSASAFETGPVLTWVPVGCTATKLMVFSQQANPIDVTLRVGTPGHMVSTALTCSPTASGGSCTATGSIAVAAGSFVDLIVSKASGNPAGVWTALSCD